MDELTDSDLLSRWCSGDREALAVLVTRHYGLVQAACRRQTSPGDDEDCVQAVFVILARRPRAAANAPVLAAWLQRTAWFVCRNMRRAVQSRRQAERDASEANRARERVMPEALDYLDDCLLKLPDRQRAAVTLHYLAGKTTDEVALLLGTSRDSTYQLLSRGLGSLRTHLARRGVAMVGTSLVSVLTAQAHAACSAVPTASRSLFPDTASAHARTLASWSQSSMRFAFLTPLAAAMVLILAAGTLTLAVSAEVKAPSTSSSMTALGSIPGATAAPKVAIPPWAAQSGVDHFGTWADLHLGSAVQRFRWIPPGSFRMGTPAAEQSALWHSLLAAPPGSPPTNPARERSHLVTITRGFWLADSACTQSLWSTVTGFTPSGVPNAPGNPVEMVSWDDCQVFLSQLSARMAGGGFRLPSEAEWEYACRAGTTSTFSLGATITPQLVNYCASNPRVSDIFGPESGGWYRQQTVAVRSLPPNPWGLFEMHGNVDQWCADWFADYPSAPQLDPTGPSSGIYRVSRGGSFLDCALSCRSGSRSSAPPRTRCSYLGLRIAAPASSSAAPRQAMVNPAPAIPGSTPEDPLSIRSDHATLVPLPLRVASCSTYTSPIFLQDYHGLPVGMLTEMECQGQLLAGSVGPWRARMSWGGSSDYQPGVPGITRILGTIGSTSIAVLVDGWQGTCAGSPMDLRQGNVFLLGVAGDATAFERAAVDISGCAIADDLHGTNVHATDVVRHFLAWIDQDPHARSMLNPRHLPGPLLINP